MTAYLPKTLTVYNKRGATPVTYEARKACLHQTFRASFTLAASRYIGPADPTLGRNLPLGARRPLIQSIPQGDDQPLPRGQARSEEHTSELHRTSRMPSSA